MKTALFKKIFVAVLAIAVMFYAPFVLSKVMNIAGLQSYWVGFWLLSYSLYIAGGILFVRLFKRNEEPVIAGIAFLILMGHWLFLGSLASTKYFLSHSFYGLLVLAATMSVARGGVR